MTDAGTYALVLSLPADATLQVGALGEHRLPAGGYTYVGSALGSGGFARVDRECAAARDLAAESESEPLPGFGASDCDCSAHLVRFAGVEVASEHAARVFERLRRR